MTQQMASRILTGQGILAVVAIAAVTLLAWWRIVDGTAAVAVILAVTGVTGGANVAVQAQSSPPPHDHPPAT